MSFSSRSLSTVVWLACLTLLAIAVIRQLEQPRWLRGNVFDLLPASDYDALTAAAVETAERELGDRLLFLVGHAERATARAAAEELAAGLASNRRIEHVTARTGGDDRVAAFADFYFPRRRRLLTDAQMASIESDGGRSLLNAAVASMYSPLAAPSSSGLLADPFALFPKSAGQLQPDRGALELEDGYLWTSDGDADYVLVTARAPSAELDMGSQGDLVEEIESRARETTRRHPGVRILRTGFLFYAEAGTESARSEISLIGMGSLAGVLALILGLFRSVRPLALGVLTIGSGCLLALALTLWTFGSIHLFTLVVGASLIGVSIDYTFHYLAHEAFADAAWTPETGIRRILPGITLGLITSVVAYLALTIAPFPGLKQLAVFSSGGLAGSYLTLLCCARWFRRPLRVGGRPLLLRLGSAWLAAWEAASASRRWIVAAAVAAAVAAGLLAVDVDDDVSILQNRPADLRLQEERIAELLGSIPANTFLLVRSRSAEAVLRREEAVRGILEEQVAAGTLDDYVAVSRYAPSGARQRSSLEAYRALVRERLPELFARLGVPGDDRSAVSAALTQPAEPFTVHDWLEHPVSEPLRGLWIGEVAGSRGSIVLLEGLRDPDALKAAIGGVAGVSVVDRRADLSQLLGAYRERITGLLIAGYAAIWLLLAMRYGPVGAAKLLGPPVLAGLAAIAAWSVLGAPINLFSLLALVLVLGIGIDFTLFIAESRGELDATMLAITLSAMTTVLSFGLLALSSTFAVRAFGFTVLVGIACCFLLAPMAVDVFHARRRSVH